MVRGILTLASVLAFVGVGSPALANGCKGCELVAKKGEGFCCGKGKVFSVELSSKQLYEALVGKAVEEDKVECAGCKVALKTNGICNHCNVGVAGGKLYHSMIAHALAKGKPITAKEADKCGGCKTAYKSDGFCEGCDVGFVAGRMFNEKAAHEIATAAFKTLAKAVETAQKCPTCAVAMVTDGECPSCKISYKGGKKTG